VVKRSLHKNSILQEIEKDRKSAVLVRAGGAYKIRARTTVPEELKGSSVGLFCTL